MNTSVKLKEWNGTDYDETPCRSLSEAIARMEENPETILVITDTDSTGEITIAVSGASPIVMSYVP